MNATTTTGVVNRRWLDRRTAGTAMIVVGLVGVLVGLATMVIGHRMVGKVEHSVDASLSLTDEALVAVADSVEVTGTIVQTVRSGLEKFVATVDVLDRSFTTGGEVIRDADGFLGGSLPNGLDAVILILPTIQDVANSVDDALRVLSRAPFGPDYEPQVPFDDAVGQIATAMAPLPGQLRQLASGFGDLATSATDIQTELRQLGSDLDDLDSQLASVGTLVERYSRTTGDARQQVTRSREDLADSSSDMRLLVVLLGIVVVLGQIVPLWLGFALRARSSSTRQVIAGDHDGSPSEVRDSSHEPAGL